MKKNISLIIGIALPIFFVIVLSLVIFIPTLLLHPQYNFLYTDDDTYYGYNNQTANNYGVENGKLILVPLVSAPGVVYKSNMPTLYMYDVKTDSSHQISFEQASGYSIDPGPTSADGYVVRYNNNYSGYGLFGGGSNESGYVVSKGSASRKLSGMSASGYYYQFKFIGWIK